MHRSDYGVPGMAKAKIAKIEKRLSTANTIAPAIASYHDRLPHAAGRDRRRSNIPLERRRNFLCRYRRKPHLLRFYWRRMTAISPTSARECTRSAHEFTHFDGAAPRQSGTRFRSIVSKPRLGVIPAIGVQARRSPNAYREHDGAILVDRIALYNSYSG